MRWRTYLRALGPGLITGASDDDPSGIATYAQTGAKFGFGMLWVALFTFPLMAAVQEICDRTALASGKGLGELIVVRFQRRSRIAIFILLGLLIIANALNIAADLVAIGAGMQLLHAGPEALWALIAGALLITLVFTGSFDFTARVLKIFCVALLAYIVVLFSIKVPWGSVVLHTIAPHLELSKGYLALLIGVLGTTISPYLFFWQSMHRIEDMRDEAAGGKNPLALTRRSRMAAAKKQSYESIRRVLGDGDIERGDVRDHRGDGGHVGRARPSRVHRFTGAGSVGAEARRGTIGVLHLRLRIHRFGNAGDTRARRIRCRGAVGNAGSRRRLLELSAQGTALLRALRVGIGGGMTLSLLSVNPITLLVFVAVINGVAAAPFLAVTMLVSSDRGIMGTYVNGRLARILGWGTVALMTLAAVLLLVV